MKVGGKILTSDLDRAKIFLKYYCKVSNFRQRRQIRKSEINSPRVTGKSAGPDVLHLDSCGHISEKQAGFRRTYNMTEQIVRLTQQIKDGFQKKQSTLVVFVDFKSAFDKHFLNIKYGNSRSGYGQTRQGLPQGSVLSPVLLNITINDLLSFIDNAVPEINSLLYAIVLWSTGSDIPKLESTLNSVLVTLANWSFENERDFKVNHDKTNFELFTLSTKKHNIKMVYNNNAILRTDCAPYLGISLDYRLTWNKHIAKVVENATNPVIDYRSELLVTASDSALSKLDIVQNKALRFITGAATSILIASRQLQTEISSSSERHQYSPLSLGERLMRKEHFWPKYIPSQTRLKTQHIFLFEFQRLANVFGIFDNRLPLFRPTIFPGHLRYASANLDLVLPVHKHNSLQAELRSVALAMIHERYPDQDWLYVFTDGSATASFGRAGAGAFSNSFNLKEPLSAREVVLQWIPSHCGIHGNEQADKLAKEASPLHPPCLLMPLQNAKQLIRDKLQQKRISTLTDLVIGKSWSCLLDGQRRAQLSALPRVEGVACFRIITGHDYLQTHLFKIGLADSPLCPLCKSLPMTGEHLSDCPALLHVLSQDNCGVPLPARATSALYWTARCLMSERTLAGVI
ncbi:uncharacterized protein LOC103524116 [Trichonephila clavipes]|nr:uncharacterized protein LOC103524116 [Trichonephila clavipes]